MAGYVFKPTYTDSAGEKRESSVWWIGYSINGRKIRESTKTTRRSDAEQFLAERVASRCNGGPAARDLARVMFGDLAEAIRADYRKHRRKSTDRMERAVRALGTEFDQQTVPAIDEAAIESYIGRRLEEGYAPATINRELSALKRMFRIGYKLRLVGRVPVIELLHEDNVRKGFFEEAELQEIMRELPSELRPLVETAYITGWRKGELLSRGWRHVDFEAGWLRLDPGETKNGKGRMFPLTDRLRTVLLAHATMRRVLEAKQSRIIPDLFFHYGGRYEGERITTFNKAWRKARDRAGLPDRIVHDFRRTAIRNLVRSGVREGVAMQMCGHKTRAVFDRYAIVDETQIREAAEMLDRLHGTGG